MLKKRKCRQQTLIGNLETLRKLSLWSKAKDKSICEMESVDYENFISFLKKTHPHFKAGSIYTHHCRTRRFFRWLVAEKLIASDPSKKTLIKQPAASLLVCSQEDVEKLRKFIASPKSDPELALLLTLILFYGFSYSEITRAQLGVVGDRLQIIVEKRKLTYLRRQQREQVLILPKDPLWFFALTRRYYQHWLKHYARIKNATLRQPLFIAHNAQYNMTIGREGIRKRIRKATILATGHPIPAAVLKHTCGTLFVRGNDASILQRLGWGSDTAWRYTWVSRKVFHPESSEN